MDWWVLELITTAILIGIAFWLGPLIKRFGKSYAADVFRANPRTGKSFIVLTDVAYYLIFFSYILFTVRFEPAANWGDTVNAEQLQHETARIAGILLIIGLLHGLNVLALPVMGRLLTLNRQLDESVLPVIVLAGAAMLIVVVVLVGLALGLTSSRPSDGTALVAIGGGGLFVLVAGAVLVAGVGLGGGDEEDAETAAAGTTTTATATRSTTRSTTVRSTVGTTTTVRPRGALEAREVAVHRNEGNEFLAPLSAIDRLSSPAVLRVTVTGFEARATGLIEQCTTQGCGNPFPVTFGDEGAARLQYLVDAEVAIGPGEAASCRPGDPPCVVRVRTAAAAVYFTTVFGGAAPAPRTVVIDTPADGVADGDAVPVTASGFTPGERVQAMLCAAPATFGTAQCGAPGAVTPFSIDDDGTGRVSLLVGRGRVGADGVACGRDTPCGVVVASAGSFVPGPVVPITFAAGPTATYDATRVLVGLLVAAFLLALATYFVRTTDWRKPTEADTPELDRAIL